MCVTRTGRCRALVSGSSLVLRRWRQSWWASCSRSSPGDSQLWGWHTSDAEHDQREHDDDHGDVRQQTTVDTSVAEEEGRNISLRCRVSGVAIIISIINIIISNGSWTSSSASSSSLLKTSSSSLTYLRGSFFCLGRVGDEENQVRGGQVQDKKHARRKGEEYDITFSCCQSQPTQRIIAVQNWLRLFLLTISLQPLKIYHAFSESSLC